MKTVGSADTPRRLDGGSVRLVGRIKDIINRGGEKLAAVEIEDCLRRHPGIRTVAVVPGPDPRLGEVPVAFVVRADSAPALTAEELVAHMAASGLARQKIPRDWRFVSDLPMTASGKIQKGRLAAELSDRDSDH